MPPIRSSRPGARATVTGAVRSKKSACAFTVAMKRLTSGNGSVPTAVSMPHTLPSSTRREPVGREHLWEHRPNLLPDLTVREADPRHVGAHVERRREALATRVDHDHTGRACNRLGAQIVRVATEAEGVAALAQQRLDERTQVRDPSVVSHQQLVELTAGGDVLVLEDERTSRLHGSEEPFRHRVVDGGEHVPRAWEKTREAAVPVRDRRRARRSRSEWCAAAGDPVESLAADVVANRPERVAQMLLE